MSAEQKPESRRQKAESRRPDANVHHSHFKSLTSGFKPTLQIHNSRFTNLKPKDSEVSTENRKLQTANSKTQNYRQSPNTTNGAQKYGWAKRGSCMTASCA